MSTLHNKATAALPSFGAKIFFIKPAPHVLLKVRAKDILSLTLFVFLGLAVVIFSISSGSYDINMIESFKVLFAIGSTSEEDKQIIWGLRMPRLLAAILCGSALSIAGVVLQSITRNALASPGLIGVEAGASVTLLLFIVALPNIVSSFWLPFSAMIGGVSVALFIYLLSSFGRFSPIRLILIGIGISSILGAISDLLITYGDIDRVESALLWLGGSLHQVNWPQINVMSTWYIVAAPPIWLLFRELNLLTLSETTAVSCGVNHKIIIPFLLICSVTLTSASVATVGTLTFVGLMAPHIARQFCGNRHGILIPLSALVGSVLVLLGDTVGRLLFSPLQLPAGLVIVLFGSPYFIFLILRINRQQTA